MPFKLYEFFYKLTRSQYDFFGPLNIHINNILNNLKLRFFLFIISERTFYSREMRDRRRKKEKEREVEKSSR